MKNISNKSILVVDDDARMLRAIDKVLAGEGAVVTCASWAGDAIEILTSRQKQIDLVITDLRMPFVSGLTAVYAIRKIFKQLPILVLTAFGSPYVKAECLRQGATAFLEKPLDSQQLVDVIKRIFHSHEFGGDVIAPDGNGTGGQSAPPKNNLKSSTKERNVYEHNLWQKYPQ